MLLGQAILYLNPRTVQKFTVTSCYPIPEINLKAGNFRAFNRYELNGNDVLNREVIHIDCVDNMINFEIE